MARCKKRDLSAEFQAKFEIVKDGEWYRIAHRLYPVLNLDLSNAPRWFICDGTGYPIGYRRIEQAQFIFDRGYF
jgi:hypothetical protein